MFDRDLSRVSFEHYITGASAINWISDDAETGGWHRLNYFDSGAAMKVVLAGIHFPDTRPYFGDGGVLNDTAQFESLGFDTCGRQIYVANHYRAAADMVVKWAAGSAPQCSVEISDWFPRRAHVGALLALFEAGRLQLEEDGLWARIQCWLATQQLSKS